MTEDPVLIEFADCPIDIMERGRYWRTSAYAEVIEALSDVWGGWLLYKLFYVRPDEETRDPVRVPPGARELFARHFAPALPAAEVLTVEGGTIRFNDAAGDVDVVRARQHVRDVYGCPGTSGHIPSAWEGDCWRAYTRRKMLRAGMIEVDDNDAADFEGWAMAARRLSAGCTATALVLRVGMTTALVAVMPGVWADLGVTQMREAGFGPKHWFSLADELKVGDVVVVRVTAFDAAGREIEVEFVRMDSGTGSGVFMLLPDG